MSRCKRSIGVPLLVALTCALCCFLCAVARAEEPPPTPPTASGTLDEITRRAIAATLHDEGVELYKARDIERALDRFQRAYEAWPSLPDAENAAFCHEKLGHFVEAIEAYDNILARFAANLTEDDRTRIQARRTPLLAKVAELLIDANVDGNIVIDGSSRGPLPLKKPIYVEPGSHRLRVSKEGYATSEVTFTVDAGKTQSIGLRLTPLLDQGRLRVEDPDGAATSVIIDGAEVGPAPWEGALAPGKHAVWTRGNGVGSAPAVVIILRGQTALHQPPSRPLGPPVRVHVEPPSAQVFLDDAALGSGDFSSRLPEGSYKFSIHAEGYRSQSTTIIVAASSAPITRTVRLEPIPREKPEEPWILGAPWFGATLGLATGASLGSGPEDRCATGCEDGLRVDGAIVVGRVGWELPSRISGEVFAGYLAFSRDVTEEVGGSYSYALEPRDVRYRLDHEVRLRGAAVGLGASYRLAAASGIDVWARLGAGAFFASFDDPMVASVAGDGSAVSAWTAGDESRVGLTRPFVAPEVGFAVALWKMRLGLSMGFYWFPGGGTALNDVEVGPLPGACTPNAPVPGCAPGQRVDRGGAEGPMILWAPSLSASLGFESL